MLRICHLTRTRHRTGARPVRTCWPLPLELEGWAGPALVVSLRVHTWGAHVRCTRGSCEHGNVRQRVEGPC